MMNEKILILLEKAKRECGEPGPFTADEYLNKFAELIVRECANRCDLLLDHKISSEWSRGTHDCSLEIRKHFGIVA